MNITVYSSFDALPAPALQRWSFPTQANFFLSLDWFRVLAEAGMPNTTQLRLYLATDSSGLPAALLACCNDPGSRTLRSLTNFYTTEFGAACLGDASSMVEVLPAFSAYLAAERPAWHRIDLRLLQASDPLLETLQQSLQLQGFAVRRYFQFETWFIATPETGFDAYFAARPSQLRNTVSRRERKLKREHACTQVIVREPGDALESALKDFITVYQGSWKNPEPYPDFIAALVRAAARCGVLRLGVLSVDGQPAAAQLWMTTPGRATIYKLAYDEKYRDLSVGSVLSSALFRMALDEDRVAEIDYGVGSEPYKRDWMTSVRNVEGLACFNLRTWRGRAFAGLEAAKYMARHVRNRLKKSSNQTS